MYKLSVVGGPAKGASYAVKDGGETTIGRVEGNDIVLTSQKVSKKHCVLVVDNSGVQLKDAGSSNGTFVNGVLTKLRKLSPGDRVSVGEFVLELVKLEAPRAKAAVPSFAGAPSNVVPLHAGGSLPGQTNLTLSAGVPAAPAPPKDLKEKLKFFFEQYILNFLYNVNQTQEWRMILVGLISALCVLAVVFAVFPVMEKVQEKLTNEAAGRALVLARQLVDRNTPYIFDRMESKIEVGYVEKEPGVTSAYVTDMEGRILAPNRKLGQSITDATESAFAATARARFHDSENMERFVRTYGDTIAVAVPLRIFSSSAGKNVGVAMGLVFYDRTLTLIDSGTEILAYAQALILAAIVGVIVFFSIYRLTLRPLQALNEEIDQVLKGNAASVTKKYKMEEIDGLIDVVNTALQRASGGANAGAGGGAEAAEEAAGLMRFLGERMVGYGIVVLSPEKRILSWSPSFEEFTSIRADSAIGNDVASVARDAAFPTFVDDLVARAGFVGGGEASSDTFEFSGVGYRLDCMGVGGPGAVKYYIITAIKS